MDPLNLDSNNLFLRYGGEESVQVLKLKAPQSHSPLVKEDDWEYVATVGTGYHYEHQSLEIFGREIEGQDLTNLASDLHQSRLLINREGYCYLESEIVGNSDSSFTRIDFYRLNDLFSWSKYQVKPEITTVWDRRDISNGDVVQVDDHNKKVKDFYEQKLRDMQTQLKSAKSKLEESEREVAALKYPSSPRTNLAIQIPTPPPPPGPYPFEIETPGKLLRFCAETKPGHFIFEIESYAALKNSLKEAESDEFESPEFVVGNHTWVMSIYLGGNKEDNSDGYISLYLKKRRDETHRSDDIHLLLRFFIFDWKRRSYLTIQDLKMRHFDEIDKEAGIPQVIRINDFENRNNGFLRADKCRFGVEFFQLNGNSRTAGLVHVQKLDHRWAASKFTDYGHRDDITFSDRFKIHNCNWKLQLYRNGKDTEENKSLSAFLVLDDLSAMSNGKQFFVDFELRLKNMKTGGYHKRRRVAWFTQSDYEQGFNDFIPFDKFQDPDSHFIAKDCVTIEVYFYSLFKTKDI